jgi:hypothetical protein
LQTVVGPLQLPSTGEDHVYQDLTTLTVADITLMADACPIPVGEPTIAQAPHHVILLKSELERYHLEESSRLVMLQTARYYLSPTARYQLYAFQQAITGNPSSSALDKAKRALNELQSLEAQLPPPTLFCRVAPLTVRLLECTIPLHFSL